MSSLTSALRIGLRAAIWRTTPDPQTIGLTGLILWCTLSFAVALAAQYVFAGDAPLFNPYGINSSIAMLAVSLLVPAFFIPVEKRTTVLSAWFALGVRSASLSKDCNRMSATAPISGFGSSI